MTCLDVYKDVQYTLLLLSPQKNLEDSSRVTEEATQLQPFVLSSDLETYHLYKYISFVSNMKVLSVVEKSLPSRCMQGRSI